MIPYKRKEKILEYVKENDMAYIEDLQKILHDISESTIRRDLQALAKEGKLVLLRGGAAKLKEGSSFDLPLETKLIINSEVKERLSAYAASLVDDGDVVYLDSSTTVLPMVKLLKNRHITVVTSSTLIPNQLVGPNIKCIVLGGEVANIFGSIVGTITENLLATMFFDKAFMGANGFSAAGGVSSPHFTEAAKMKIVNKNSKITYMMLDSTKAGITTLCKVFELSECNIICDKYIELLDSFKSYHVVPENWEGCIDYR